MTKPYKDRSMAVAKDGEAETVEIEFFFPKRNPPVTIRAKTREEAEAKLAEADNAA